MTDIDFRRRVVVPGVKDGLECDRLFYGMEITDCPWPHLAKRVVTNFNDSHGRRPGAPQSRTQHFFNKRIV